MCVGKCGILATAGCAEKRNEIDDKRLLLLQI